MFFAGWCRISGSLLANSASTIVFGVYASCWFWLAGECSGANGKLSCLSSTALGNPTLLAVIVQCSEDALVVWVGSNIAKGVYGGWQQNLWVLSIIYFGVVVSDMVGAAK